MEQTANYGLNQWDAGDRIMVEDFNADNAKVDQALGDHEERVSTLETTCASLGNCLLYTGSYVGDGTTTPSPYAFPHKPVVVMVSAPNSATYNTIFWQGQTRASLIGADAYTLSLTWENNSVSWTSSTTEYSLNRKGATYQVVALLDAAQ